MCSAIIYETFVKLCHDIQDWSWQKTWKMLLPGFSTTRTKSYAAMFSGKSQKSM